MKYRIERDGKQYEVDVELNASGCVVRGADGEPHTLHIETRSDGSRHVLTPWGELDIVAARRGGELWAHVSGRRLQATVERARPSSAGAAGGASAGTLRAPMAGKLLRVRVQPGETVSAGQPLLVIEAMKMENEIAAPISGVVRSVNVSAPAAVDKGAVLLELEPT
jgi:biotin carboxyl carrier protein